MIGFTDLSRRFDSGAKAIKKTNEHTSKNKQKNKIKPMSIAAKTKKVYNHVKQPMSISAKTKQ